MWLYGGLFLGQEAQLPLIPGLAEGPNKGQPEGPLTPGLAEGPSKGQPEGPLITGLAEGPSKRQPEGLGRQLDATLCSAAS